MIIRLLGTELFHADRRTDMTKVLVIFRNFAKAFKTLYVNCGLIIFDL
jgi:hypothetical protein